MTRDSVRTNACECSKISRVRGGGEGRKRKGKKGVSEGVLER